MPSFDYIARDAKSGSEIVSSVDATSLEFAINALLKRNLLVVSIKETLEEKGRTFGGKATLKDLVMFTRQFSTMVDAGISVLSSLKGLAKQTHGVLMRDVIIDLCVRIENGESLSDAMAG